MTDQIWTTIGIGLFLLILVSVLRFLWLTRYNFASDFDPYNPTPDLVQKDMAILQKIIFYGYAATFLTTLVALVAPIILSSSSTITDYGRSSALGVLVACQSTTARLPTSCSENPNGEWVLNIGGRVEQLALPDPTIADQAQTAGSNSLLILENTYEVSGGVVVPLYLIVISLLGASVGMARRMPEYQKRGSKRYHQEFQYREKMGLANAADPKPLDPTEVREYVVFQVLQVFSAPLVALTAYSLITPGEPATVVILAFASGFSTEAVLLLIRRGVSRIGSSSKPNVVGDKQVAGLAKGSKSVPAVPANPIQAVDEAVAGNKEAEEMIYNMFDVAFPDNNP